MRFYRIQRRQILRSMVQIRPPLRWRRALQAVQERKNTPGRVNYAPVWYITLRLYMTFGQAQKGFAQHQEGNLRPAGPVEVRFRGKRDRRPNMPQRGAGRSVTTDLAVRPLVCWRPSPLLRAQRKQSFAPFCRTPLF